MKYYELKDDPRYNCQFIVTERGVGKTTSALKMVMDNAQYGEAIWLRRSQVELDNFYGNIRYHWITRDMPLRFEKNQMVHGYDKYRICTFIALSTCHNWASSNFDNVNLIIFDEYISESGNYLSEEMKKMINFFKTVERERTNVKLYFLSNAYSKNNPFFNYLDIRKKDIEKGEYIDDELKIKFDFVRNWKDLDIQAKNFSNMMSKKDSALYDFMHTGAFSLDDIMDACILTDIKSMEFEVMCYNIVVGDIYCGIYEKDNIWYMKRVLPSPNAVRTSTMSGLFHTHIGSMPDRFYEMLFTKLINKECFIADYDLRDQVFDLILARLGNKYAR